MPCKDRHEQFDRFLAEKGVLLPDGQYGEVHAFMDRGVKNFGSRHRELDIYHGKYNVIGQERATDWLHAGLGHICLDEANARLNKRHSWNEVFNHAYQLMFRRGWTRARFVPNKKALQSCFTSLRDHLYISIISLTQPSQNIPLVAAKRRIIFQSFLFYIRSCNQSLFQLQV